MNIGINTLATPDKKIGVGRYVDNLLTNFPDLNREDAFTIFVSKRTPEIFNTHGDNFKKALVSFPAQPSVLLAFAQPLFLRQFLRNKIEVVHWVNTMPVLFKVCPTVVTIHDLQEFYTDKYGKVRGLYRKVINFIAARLADRILTASEHSRKDISRLLRVPEEKVVVTYYGVEAAFQLRDRSQCFKRVDTKYRTSDKYVISVGELHPGKNFVRLIEAFSSLKARSLPHKLVIVGKKGWKYEQIFGAVRGLGLQDEIIFTGYVPEEDLPLLYGGAELCVYPTLYEGFGLPAMEAMACGTPLVASNVSSLPEVVDDAGILFNPYNVDEIAEAIYEVLDNEELRRELIRKGLKRAKKFSWKKTATETLEVYRDVYRESRKRPDAPSG